MKPNWVQRAFERCNRCKPPFITRNYQSCRYISHKNMPSSMRRCQKLNYLFVSTFSGRRFLTKSTSLIVSLVQTAKLTVSFSSIKSGFERVKLWKNKVRTCVYASHLPSFCSDQANSTSVRHQV